MIAIFATTSAAVLLLMLALWLISLIVDDVSIVDIFWGIGFVAIAWISHAIGHAQGPRSLLVAVLVTAWGLRLATHLGIRNLGHGEDYRYREMRRHHGHAFRWISLGTVFLLQGGLMWVISWPVQIVAVSGTPALGPLDAAATCLWAVGLLCEAVADAQLARFKRTAPTRTTGVMERGLWRYSRHPNYFGDCLVWWGLGLFGLAAGGWWTLIGPVVMTMLLVKVSGVSLVERTIVDRRPGYRAYASRTSAFVPWAPRKP